MKRLVVATAVVLAVVPAMGQENLPSFEVVSVKVNRSGADRQDMRLLPGGRAVATNVPLRRVILTAYGLLTQQLIGGPDWLDSTRFDIVAQANENLTPSAPGGPPGRERLMRGATMPNFARAILVGWTDRIVEDHTGLRGGYDIDLEFAPESGTTIGTSAGGNVPSLFTALEEQLGVKLRPGRKSVDVLVIDRLELPTEN